ncbi:patatin-like phospholipase family protein [Marinifilum fragile]|uniref:patatin-like phospholipase family protein n=1 Tax=Marinifilum fragile TaxID=570161 RepID=UPI0006D193E1|nr:patatin-like phospholipase family protein [Marinifilum fragile]
MKHSLLLILFISLNFISSAKFKTDTLENKKRPKIGLVLSGGGAKGFAHVGVLKIIDELEIPIDYIAGTSMGSIIGGFYAIGYSANQIEEMIISQNWDQLLADEISRKYVPFHEKQNYERHVLSFPIRPKGIELPSGIVKGQNVINLFERLSIDYHDVTDFRKLPIPFVCVATDIETGEAVTLDKGYLPEAMRASMAIPTVFSPIEIDGRLLVDGGMVNNFPVKEVIDMGADIVIGVDVQSGPKSKEELKSFLDIINQTVSLMALNEFKKNIDFVDVYIKPNINNYSVGSFNAADSLIHKGEEAGRKFYSELKELKEKYQLKKKKIKQYKPPADSTTYYVKNIEYEGLNDVSKSLLSGKFNLDVPGEISLSQLKQGINWGYGSKYFDQVDFRLLGNKAKTLQVRVKERTTKRFNVGLRYDSDNQAGVLLNTTFRNKLRSGSHLSFDLKLSETPRFVTTYAIDNGLKPGITLQAEYNDWNVNAYEDWEQIGNFDLDYVKLDFKIHSILRESYSVGIGAKVEYYNVKSTFTLPGLESGNAEDYFFSYYTLLRLDSHEKAYYPKRGISLYGEYKLVTNNGASLDGMERPASIAYLKVQKAISITDKFTVYPKFYGRVIWGKNIPDFFMTYTGGIDQTDYFDIQMPFVGLERMEVASTNSFVFRGDFQYELFKNNYLIFKANVGKITEDVNESLSTGEWIRGLGVTYSYNSLIGPMEFSLMYSNKKDKVLNYVSLGYWF